MEAVASQPAVVPGGSGDVTPVAGGTSLTALPSAMKELARLFLNLSGSSSLGASGDSAGVTTSGAVLGDLAGPSSTAPGAAIFCGTAAPPAGAGVLPDVDALPSVSGEHRRRVRSRSRDRRGRSSSDGTDRRAKKRSRRRSPSPEHSSHRRERRYRSSSDSSGDVRAAASPPRSRRAHGGARAGESTWDYDRSRSYARVDSSQSGTRHRSPGPSGVAEDDRFFDLRVGRLCSGCLIPGCLGPHSEVSRHGGTGNCTSSSLQDFSCFGFWLTDGFFSVVCVAPFPLVVDSPDGHKLGFVQVYGGPDRARVSSCARSPTTEVLRHLHLLFPWTLHGSAWLDLHYHGES